MNWQNLKTALDTNGWGKKQRTNSSFLKSFGDQTIKLQGFLLPHIERQQPAAMSRLIVESLQLHLPSGPSDSAAAILWSAATCQLAPVGPNSTANQQAANNVSASLRFTTAVRLCSHKICRSNKKWRKCPAKTPVLWGVNTVLSASLWQLMTIQLPSCHRVVFLKTIKSLKIKMKVFGDRWSDCS